jgi:outer membrane immunogenic protein
MRRGLLSLTAALLAGTAATNAADLRRAPPPMMTPVPVWSWTGFYAGLSAGYAFDAGNTVADLDGWFAGGQIGYNWQHGNWVFGVEADLFGGDIGESARAFGFAVSSDVNVFGTLRGRIGYAIDRVLLYGTGGFAWARNEISVFGPGIALSSSETHTGFAVGGGVEWAFAPNWSAKAEYLYLGLGSANYFGVVPSGDADFHTFKVGVNYLFYR